MFEIVMIFGVESSQKSHSKIISVIIQNIKLDESAISNSIDSWSFIILWISVDQ